MLQHKEMSVSHWAQRRWHHKQETGRSVDERFLKINHKNWLTEQQEQENKTDNLIKK